MEKSQLPSFFLTSIPYIAFKSIDTDTPSGKHIPHMGNFYTKGTQTGILRGEYKE